MMISTEKHNDIVILVAEGRLDAVGAPDIESNGKAAVQGGAKRLVLDMAKVGYVSSAGLRALLVLAKNLKAAGGKLVLCSLAPAVQEVLALSGFDAILTVAPDRSAALALLP